MTCHLESLKKQSNSLLMGLLILVWAMCDARFRETFCISFVFDKEFRYDTHHCKSNISFLQCRAIIGSITCNSHDLPLLNNRTINYTCTENQKVDLFNNCKMCFSLILHTVKQSKTYPSQACVYLLVTIWPVPAALAIFYQCVLARSTTEYKNYPWAPVK